MLFTNRLQPTMQTRRRRGRVARLIVLALLVYLIAPLYGLQINGWQEYALQARKNTLRSLVVRAPRGTIYDRHGHVVAENIVGYQVLLMPALLDSLRAKVARLQPVLGLDSADVATVFRRHARAPHLPMQVLRDAPPSAVAALQERLDEFRDVIIQEYPKRHYPAGPAIAHFIGYVSEISEPELKRPEFGGYDQGRWIGKAGLERQYERWLGGEPGMRFLEVDAGGRIHKWLPDELSLPPVPGKDLHLYLDQDLQRFIAGIFPRDRTGAIVAIDPATGGILAYYSHPTFDPNAFIGGIPRGLWRELQEDPRKPLLDRVVSSGQPAASTWKLAVAAMALDLGVIAPEEYMPIACTGGVTLAGRYARCWEPAGHGRMNLVDGIKNSCNVYFYQVGMRIGFERFMQTGSRLGFASRTGVDVPHEIKPNFPTEREYYRRRFGYRPFENEVLSLAIGQGPITMTTLKLAHIYSALARPDGRVPAPRLAMDQAAWAGKRDTLHVKLDPRDVWFLEAGMRRVVGPGGTAQLSRLERWDFIGKTGTAQNPHGKDHAWFVGMGARAPGEQPDIAVTMFLEFAEHGYTASGYVAEAIDFYLSRKHGRRYEGWATPRHRIAQGLPVSWDWNAPIQDPPAPRGEAATERAARAQKPTSARPAGGTR